jgi:hypothetical protein
MAITGVPFGVTDWSVVPSTDHPGETGIARWQTFEGGNIRVPMVEYSPGYLADHWCSRIDNRLFSGRAALSGWNVPCDVAARHVRPSSMAGGPFRFLQEHHVTADLRRVGHDAVLDVDGGL